MPTRPLIALTAGDPAGIGPEIVARALADTRLPSKVRILAIGPGVCRPPRVPVFDPNKDTVTIADRAWLITGGERDWEFGSAQASAGRAALIALRAGHELALARYVDGMVCAPVSKEALALAGERVEGQTELLGRWANAPGVQMLGLARDLRVLLLSRHLPLKQALELVTPQRVLEHLVMLDEGLQRLGFPRPRLALAGLNPHAGENGILGNEEHELLQPALALAQRAGVRVVGPLSPDTVFLRAAQGEFDGVLALYHDQAFIPLKLHAPGEGLTVLLRFPYLRVSPAHGTAFDIAGQNKADPRNLIVALQAAARFAPSYSAAASAPRS
ncbi:MAG: 4-hydroxythreonine-4-phosphate dehydrogenase PdxA [Planctomycetes bacterium]|nr:4-hydroxythreonine-4-phosphate dehydrogenase PdxA [Planctomycetota bacterium]